MTSFRTLTRFLIFQQNNYFCPHIAERAQYRRFWKKTFGDIGPPPVIFFGGISKIILLNYFQLVFEIPSFYSHLNRRESRKQVEITHKYYLQIIALNFLRFYAILKSKNILHAKDIFTTF
jgi:hypothetical protein